MSIIILPLEQYKDQIDRFGPNAEYEVLNFGKISMHALLLSSPEHGGIPTVAILESGAVWALEQLLIKENNYEKQ